MWSLAGSRRRSHEGASPLKLPAAGRGRGSGFHGGVTQYADPSGRLAPPMVPSQNQPSSPTLARKGSMEQSVHRPLSQSGLPIVRRVNSVVGERVGFPIRLMICGFPCRLLLLAQIPLHRLEPVGQKDSAARRDNAKPIWTRGACMRGLAPSNSPSAGTWHMAHNGGNPVVVRIPPIPSQRFSLL